MDGRRPRKHRTVLREAHQRESEKLMGAVTMTALSKDLVTPRERLLRVNEERSPSAPEEKAPTELWLYQDVAQGLALLGGPDASAATQFVGVADPRRVSFSSTGAISRIDPRWRHDCCGRPRWGGPHEPRGRHRGPLPRLLAVVWLAGREPKRYVLHGPGPRRRWRRDRSSQAWRFGQRVSVCSGEGGVGGTVMPPISTSSCAAGMRARVAGQYLGASSR